MEKLIKDRERNRRYREANKEKENERHKLYYNENKEKEIQRYRKYREENYDKVMGKRRERIICTCGKSVRKETIERHKTSKKHLNN